MKGKRIKQINNLVIRYTEDYQYAVWTPDGRCWEDKMTLEQAEEFCKETSDFVVNGSRVWLKNLDEIDKDCIFRYEYLLGRKLKNYNEYVEIDGFVDEMILDWESKKDFFKAYPELKEYRC